LADQSGSPSSRIPDKDFAGRFDSLSLRGTSGERVGERGNLRRSTFLIGCLLSPALSSIGWRRGSGCDFAALRLCVGAGFRFSTAWFRPGLLLVVGIFALSEAGCAYRLGPTNGQASGARSIQIAPFQNKTIEPRLVEAVSFAFRKQLQQDGTYKLDTHDEGDVILHGTIVSYVRSGISFQSRDALTPRDYRLTITALVTAKERTSGKVLLNRTVTGHSDIRIGTDLASAERQALPLVAEDLARNATALLVDGTW
jgi:hypothetical protein